MFQEPVEAIYANAEGIYTFGQGTPNDFSVKDQVFTQQEPSESTSVPDIGFGDLPSDEVDVPKLLSAREFFDNITEFNGIEGLEADSQLEQIVFNNDLSSIQAHPELGILVDTTTQSISADSFYSVSEPPEVSSQERDVTVEASSVIDITDETFGDLEVAEGVVEEVITEGRRTEVSTYFNTLGYTIC
jgi:hypothetical protein